MPTTSFIVWLSVYVVIGIALMPTYQFLSGVEKVTPLAVSTTLCAVGVIGAGILLAHGHGLVGLAMAMALSKLVTFWPIQLFEVRRVLRAAACRFCEFGVTCFEPPLKWGIWTYER